MNTLRLVWISEWIKLRSVRSTWWAVGGAVGDGGRSSTGRHEHGQRDEGCGSADWVGTV